MSTSSGPTYPTARAVAQRLEARIAAAAIDFDRPGIAPKPDAIVIEEVISAAFWASLLREEGKAPTISLAFVPPDRVDMPMTFESRLALTPEVLGRLAPAVERPGIHLGVWWYGGQLCVWGTTRSVPTWCFIIEVIAPGLLVVKYRRADASTKFANVAVLEGANVKFVAQQEAVVPEVPPVLNSLLAFYSSAGYEESDNVLVRLAVSMRAHGRGGSLLVVPKGGRDWQQSIVQPIFYSIFPPFSELGGLRDNPDALRSAVEALAGPTAVDGATVISDQFELLAFGVKIIARDGAPHVERIFVTEPVEGANEVVVEPSQLGNTRHLSAAQFVSDQRDSIALIASQDGRFTVFTWSPTREMVRAHRLETLLL